ncbi:hypothetical protein OG342_06850 [Streptomyces bobili]|uniref:hypothetical protein n=1 Tax=Streptomyces bobili TaxID=67280 RepID=UPI00224D242E|nr:hypothetical protein [Streptomyces bobili]MCX5522581.1 hypothetical protein [Streptomyces bobili]
MAIPGNLLSSATESMDPSISGWTAKLNCTLSKGTGGRNGDGVLTVKSVAAGEMQARTVSSYPVAAGTTYEALADASCATLAERIGIRWLTSTGTEVSITWSLTTTAASASWHRISVAGAAPAGATQAQVLLSSMTPAAGNVNHFFENVYLGPPHRSVGNLFGYNAESAEVDGSAWTSETNSTVSRQVPPVTWSVDWFWGGGHVIAMTATAGGNATMRMVDRPAVTPGVEYVGNIYLNPPTSGSVTWVEMRFYDAGGTQIQATRSQLAAPGTGYYRQIVSDIAPALAASCSLAVGIDSATAGQVLRVDTALIRTVTPIMAGTVIPYANGSFEQSTGGWTVASGVATLARSTPWGTAGWVGSYSLAVSSATATSSTWRSGMFEVPGGAGLNWRSQIILRINAGTWPTVTLKIRWYNASNVDLGVTTGAAFALPAGSYYLLQHDATAPATAAKAAIEVVGVAGTAPSSLWMDAVALWQALPLMAVVEHDDDAYVTLTLRELPADYLITVYRVTPDGTRTPVRGPTGLYDKDLITSDLLIIEDHEAPLETSVYYFIEVYTAAGVLAFTRSSSPITLDVDDVNYAWLKDPGNPQRNIRVMVARAPDWQRPIEQAAFTVRGRRNKVVLSGVRQGLEGDLTIYTQDNEERAALHWLLDSGNTLLWQAAPGMGVSDMYVTVGQITEARVGALAQETWRLWTLPLVEADMPVTTGVNGSADRTWQDVLSGFATWQAVLDAYPTWEAVLLDQRR